MVLSVPLSQSTDVSTDGRRTFADPPSLRPAHPFFSGHRIPIMIRSGMFIDRSTSRGRVLRRQGYGRRAEGQTGGACTFLRNEPILGMFWRRFVIRRLHFSPVPARFDVGSGVAKQAKCLKPNYPFPPPSPVLKAVSKSNRRTLSGRFSSERSFGSCESSGVHV